MPFGVAVTCCNDKLRLLSTPIDKLCTHVLCAHCKAGGDRRRAEAADHRKRHRALTECVRLSKQVPALMTPELIQVRKEGHTVDCIALLVGLLVATKRHRAAVILVVHSCYLFPHTVCCLAQRTNLPCVAWHSAPTYRMLGVNK